MSRDSESGTQHPVPSVVHTKSFVDLSSSLKSVLLGEEGYLFIIQFKMELEIVKVDLTEVLAMLSGLGLNWG